MLELSGAFKKDPQRAAARSEEPEPSGPVGGPSLAMTETERDAWRWIVDRCPTGVLGNCDEGLLEIASGLRARLVSRKLDDKGAALLLRCYTELGMTPASRSKVRSSSAGKVIPLNEFAAV